MGLQGTTKLISILVQYHRKGYFKSKDNMYITKPYTKVEVKTKEEFEIQYKTRNKTILQFCTPGGCFD